MTSYLIIDLQNTRLFSGGFSETKVFAENYCASFPSAVLYQVRFKRKGLWGQFAYEYTNSGYRQVSRRRPIHKSEIKRNKHCSEVGHV